MNELLQVFNYICVNLNDLLVLTADDWRYHSTNMEQVPIKLQENTIRHNIENSFRSQSEMEYLGFWVKY